MSVNSNKKILDASKLSLILSRLASQIFENHLDFSDVVLIGIQPRGKILSQKIIMKFLPKILFRKDESFEYAEKIENLIKQSNK